MFNVGQKCILMFLTDYQQEDHQVAPFEVEIKGKIGDVYLCESQKNVLYECWEWQLEKIQP